MRDRDSDAFVCKGENREKLHPVQPAYRRRPLLTGGAVAMMKKRRSRADTGDMVCNAPTSCSYLRAENVAQHYMSAGGLQR